MGNKHLKLPPHNIEAELAILGAILNDNGAFHRVDDIIDADHFFRMENRLVYARIWAMTMQGRPVDMVTLVDALADAGEVEKIAPDYLNELDPFTSSAHVEHYARIVRDKYMERRLLTVANDVAEDAMNGHGTVQEKLSSAQRAFFDITVADETEPVSVDQTFTEVLQEIQRRAESDKEIHGQPTGFKDLDKRLGGLVGGRFYIVAGRPGMGKSVMAMNIAENFALNDQLAIVFSLEMPREQNGMRLMSSVSRVPYGNLLSGNVTDPDISEKLSAGAAKIKGKPLYIDDSYRLTSANVASRARRIAQKQGMPVGLVVVDYLQLLSDQAGRGGDSETNRITQISRNLKLAAHDLQCPVIAVSQLNRGLEARPNKRPVMSDLRESGAIEQDADAIIMAYRDEEYNPDTENKGIAEMIIRKNRDGEKGTVYLASRLHMMRFDDLAPGEMPGAPTHQSRYSGGMD